MKNVAIRLLLLLSFVVKFTISYAQETTKGDVKVNINTSKNSVVIIPFEPRLYFSDIDFLLEQKNGLTSKEIKSKFRAGLDLQILMALRSAFNPFSYFTVDEAEAREELSKIYNSIGYEYEPLPVEKKQETKKSIFSKSKKEEPQKQSGAEISNGEIVSWTDNSEKFMKTKLSTKELIDELNKNRNANYYLFVNQLDIKRSTVSQALDEKNNLTRKIAVHYTIFDAAQKEIAAGIVDALVDSKEMDLDAIIKTQFSIVAEKLATKIIEQ